MRSFDLSEKLQQLIGDPPGDWYPPLHEDKYDLDFWNKIDVKKSNHMDLKRGRAGYYLMSFSSKDAIEGAFNNKNQAREIQKEYDNPSRKDMMLLHYSPAKGFTFGS